MSRRGAAQRLEDALAKKDVAQVRWALINNSPRSRCESSDLLLRYKARR